MIIHVLRDEGNLRTYFKHRCAYVLIAAPSRRESACSSLSCSRSCSCSSEMLNTAVEAAIDATTSFDPMVKPAKRDTLAGTLIAATVVAAAVGYLAFSGPVANRSRLLDRLSDFVPFAEVAPIALVLTISRRHRREGPDTERQPLRRRPAVRARGGRACDLDGKDADPRRLHTPVRRAVAADPRRVAGSRRPARQPGIHSSYRVAVRRRPGALVTLAVFQVAQSETSSGGPASARAPTRRTRSSHSRRRIVRTTDGLRSRK